METHITIFNNPQFGDIRTAGTADNPLFCLADVCKVLELRVDGVMPRLKKGGYNRIGVGVQTGTKKDGSPAMQEVCMIFINEQNLYKVIMRSDKPQVAQDFGMSAKAFNVLLRNFGIQHKVAGQWILYAKYLPLGYVQSEPILIDHKSGRKETKMFTKWTQKGRLFLYEELKQHGILPLIERAA